MSRLDVLAETREVLVLRIHGKAPHAEPLTRGEALAMGNADYLAQRAARLREVGGAGAAGVAAVNGEDDAAPPPVLTRL